MGFRYDNLWDILEQRKITKDELRFKIRCSPATLVKMQNNGNISLDVIDRICEVLECLPSDVMEYVPKEKSLNLTRERKKGDIVVLSLYLNHGTTDDNVRLGVVFQNNIYLNEIRSTPVFPLSSNVSLNSKINNVIIQPDDNNNLEYPFAVEISNMRMLRTVHIREKYGRLSVKDINAIDEAVKNFFDL